MVAQLEKSPILVPGTKVRVVSGQNKGQTGVVIDRQPKSKYQKLRACGQLLPVTSLNRELEEISLQ